MFEMINDNKKEEIRDTADIVEVVGDYVKLKKSGSGFMGLCPFHDEKTPSFHVTPRLGIYKCFGCGESGDVFNFIMEMEGVSFPESLRSLADRYGIDIPDEHVEGHEDQTRVREGVYHALKYAGLYFYRQLRESDDAEKARKYLEERGYDQKIIRTFGLGYAPGKGSALLDEATKEGIDEEYLVESDLVKPSQRSDGFYDTFRDRLMFPIFNPSGKVIAFAGRILNNDKKTAKYVNSAQTQVYNKSEVVYGVNFAKNEIRREEEVILVEGYTDVISMYQNGIKNVVASSGTSLTSGQIRILQRYGNRIIMIYDSDAAGQKAMERGINIALAEGMEVYLLELPDGEDPDSFVKQFGGESFLDLKKKNAEDFVTFTVMKAERGGDMERPGERAAVINKVLESIAQMPDEIQRQVYVQHLHQKTQKYRKGSDRELFQQLEKLLAEKKRQDERSRLRSKRQEQGKKQQAQPEPGSMNQPPQMPPSMAEERGPVAEEMQEEKPYVKRPKFEMEVIRLLLLFGKPMQKFIGHNVSEDHFEDEDLKTFYMDIMKRHIEEEEVSVEHYSNREKPYPSLLGDILLERFAPSEKHAKATGNEYKKDKYPIKTAKSSMKPLRLNFYERKRRSLTEELKNSSDEKRIKLVQLMTKIQREISRIQKLSADELFDDPDFVKTDPDAGEKVFQYKMKGEN